MHLKNAVDVGLVLGTSAAMTPIGSAICTMPRGSSRPMMPTVLMSRIAAHRSVEVKQVLQYLVFDDSKSCLFHRHPRQTLRGSGSGHGHRGTYTIDLFLRGF